VRPNSVLSNVRKRGGPQKDGNEEGEGKGERAREREGGEGERDRGKIDEPTMGMMHDG